MVVFAAEISRFRIRRIKCIRKWLQSNKINREKQESFKDFVLYTAKECFVVHDQMTSKTIHARIHNKQTITFNFL